MVLNLVRCFVNIIFCFTIISAQFYIDSEEIREPLLEFDFVQFIQPLNYDVHLIISSTEEFHAYDGIVKINFESKIDSKHFQFISGAKINVTRVKLVNLRTQNEITDFELKRMTRFYTFPDEAFLISNDSNVINQSEVYQLEIWFSNTIDQDYDKRGFFASNYYVNGEISYFAATHFEKNYIRYAIPTFEDVSFKVPFKLRITHHPKYTALSNMPGRILAGSFDRVTTEFDETPPMPGYILAFAIGEFKSKPVPNERNLAFNIYGSSKIYNETDDATATSGKILMGMEDYFGIQYALPKMDYLIIPRFPFYGMENWGLVVFLESKIFGSWTNTKTSNLVENTVVNAHQLAHQYFGNLVTPKTWRYVWLSEGFATFFSYHILNRVFPNDIYSDQFLLDNLFTSYKLEQDQICARVGRPSISNAANQMNNNKASSIIRMIMHAFGETRFREATIMYLEQYKYNSTIPTDLINVYKSVMKNDPSWPANIDIESFIESWTHQCGAPFVKVTRNYVNGDIEVKQESDLTSLYHKDRNRTWWLPYSYATKLNPDFEDTTPNGWLANEQRITLNMNIRADDWIIFNKQYTGVYVVNYDNRNWELLINELIYGNHELIHVNNRAQLIHDSTYLSKHKLVDRKYLVKLMFYLKNEKNFLPWKVSDTFLDKVWEDTKFTKYADMTKMAIRYMSGDAYDYYRLNAQQHDTRSSLLTRTIVTKWACRSGHQTCLRDYDNLSEQYYNSLISQQPTVFVHPDLKENLLCYGFQNETNFNRVFEFFLANSNHPDADEFFSLFRCRVNTKLFRTYYHVVKYNIAIENRDNYPAYDKVRWIVKFYQGDEISIVTNCMLENCFDFRLYAPNKYENKVADVVANTLHARYITPEDIPRIELMLVKVHQIYGDSVIYKIGRQIHQRFKYLLSHNIML